MTTDKPNQSGSAPQRDMNIERTPDEGARTQRCINDLAEYMEKRRAQKAAEKAAQEASQSEKTQDQPG